MHERMGRRVKKEDPRSVEETADGASNPRNALLDTLYREHAEHVYKLLRRHGLAHEDAEDMKHDIFTRLPYLPQPPPRGWRMYLTGAAIKTANGHWRRLGRQLTSTVAPTPDDWDALLGSDDVTPQDLVVAERLYQWLLSRLPEHLRGAHLLHEDGFEPREIAACYGISVDLTYRCLKRATDLLMAGYRRAERRW